MKRFKQHIDDISFLLGAFFITLGGFLIYIPIGFLILGVAFVAYAFIFAQSIKGGGD
jgi:hypothetical protein